MLLGGGREVNRRFWRLTFGRLFTLRWGQRKYNDESGAMGRSALDGNGTSMLLDYPPGHGQPKPRPGGFGCKKRFKHLVYVFR